MASIEDRGTRAYVPSYEIAKVYLALGHSDDAVRWLEWAYDEQSHSMAFLRVDSQPRERTS